MGTAGQLLIFTNRFSEVNILISEHSGKCRRWKGRNFLKKIKTKSCTLPSRSLKKPCDTTGDTFSGHQQGNNFSISINAESKEEADKLFNGLSAGGRVTMPMEDTFWGAYFGMFTDKFGINWMVNYDDPAKAQHP
jgi:PhnB protein